MTTNGNGIESKEKADGQTKRRMNKGWVQCQSVEAWESVLARATLEKCYRKCTCQSLSDNCKKMTADILTKRIRSN
jgi:hypothetical protein